MSEELHMVSIECRINGLMLRTDTCTDYDGFFHLIVTHTQHTHIHTLYVHTHHIHTTHTHTHTGAHMCTHTPHIIHHLYGPEGANKDGAV